MRLIITFLLAAILAIAIGIYAPGSATASSTAIFRAKHGLGENEVLVFSLDNRGLDPHTRAFHNWIESQLKKSGNITISPTPSGWSIKVTAETTIAQFEIYLWATVAEIDGQTMQADVATMHWHSGDPNLAAKVSAFIIERLLNSPITQAGKARQLMPSVRSWPKPPKFQWLVRSGEIGDR